MSKEDDVFYREFGLIVGFLFVFFLIALFAARAIGANAFEAAMLAPGEVEKRIQPVGQVSFGEAGVMAEPEQELVEIAMADPRGGEEVYNSACVACHATGVADAPKIGDAAAWEPRVAQGLEALVNSALNGKGALMPPKGGRPDFSDDEVIAGLKYMLEETGVTAN